MSNLFFILFGKVLSKFFRLLNLGDGSTWPGHIALSTKQNFIKDMLYSNPNVKVILIAGTNGKTTTAAMIKSVLKKSGFKSFQNKSGANLLNGVASSLIIHADLSGRIKRDFAIFEIDENALPQILEECSPDYLILLNLFRDQLDRYGEVNIVAEKWRESIDKLTNKTTLILNADDPQIAYFAQNTKAKKQFFGVREKYVGNKNPLQAADSNYCPKCGNKLNYKQITFSHLGDWFCENCGLKRPKLDLDRMINYPLPGVYNKYDTNAAVLTLKNIGLDSSEIESLIADFKPAFGRQEIIKYKNKNVQIFLSKNPTSFNQSFQTISDLGAETLLIVLNDRIPDGRDISWIWDTDLLGINSFKHVLISGDRAYDMALRLKYELGIRNFESTVRTFEDLNEAINNGADLAKGNETLFILPTYSAMLDARKILTGKKIL